MYYEFDSSIEKLTCRCNVEELQRVASLRRSVFSLLQSYFVLVHVRAAKSVTKNELNFFLPCERSSSCPS